MAAIKKIIFATGSPSRKRLFRTLGLRFSCEESRINEYFDGRPTDPEELVRTLARLKAEAVAKRHYDGIIFGFDSVAHRSSILEKPKSKEEAFHRLKRLSGRDLRFYTGVHMIDLYTGKTDTRAVMTAIFMRRLSSGEIKTYLDSDPDYHKYAIGFSTLDKYSASFIKRIKGSYTNVVYGLPLETVMLMLGEDAVSSLRS